MRLPLPRHKLVALSLVAALFGVAASVALALPGLLPADTALPADAPPEDPSFTPAVAPRSYGDDDEWEEDEDDHEGRWWDDD